MEPTSQIDQEIISLLRANLRPQAIFLATKKLNISVSQATKYVNQIQDANGIITPPSKKTSFIASIGSALIVLFVVFKLVTCGDDKATTQVKPEQTAPGGHKDMAYIKAKKYAKSELKYPEEADFDWSPTISQDNGKGAYHETGYVVSKNGFGVKQKLYFDCYLTFDGGDEYDDSKWSLISIEVKEDE